MCQIYSNNRSKFVLSPPGNGFDCHRTYESILLGAVPIVVRDNPALTREVYTRAPAMVMNKYWWRPKPTEEKVRIRHFSGPEIKVFLSYCQTS